MYRWWRRSIRDCHLARPVPARPPPLKDGEILLSVEESSLAAKPGDEITLAYFPRFTKACQGSDSSFNLRALIPLAGAASTDIARFSGITDADIKD